MTNIGKRVDQWWQCYNTHDLEGLLALMSDDVVGRFATTPVPVIGKENLRTVWSGVFSMVIPDIHNEVLRTVVQGRTAASESIETGTFHLPNGSSDPSTDAAADGHPYRLSVASFFDFNSAGLVRRCRSFWDTAGFSEQVGIEPAVLRAAAPRRGGAAE